MKELMTIVWVLAGVVSAVALSIGVFDNDTIHRNNLLMVGFIGVIVSILTLAGMHEDD